MIIYRTHRQFVKRYVDSVNSQRREQASSAATITLEDGKLLVWNRAVQMYSLIFTHSIDDNSGPARFRGIRSSPDPSKCLELDGFKDNERLLKGKSMRC